MAATTNSMLYRKKENVRLRPVDEWGALLAYTPDNPNVVYLNPTAQLVLAFVDGQPYDGAKGQFVDFMADAASPEDAAAAFDEGLQVLETVGIVEATVEDARQRPGERR